MSLVYAFIFRLFSWSRVGAEILAADFVFSQIIAIRTKFLSVDLGRDVNSWFVLSLLEAPAHHCCNGVSRKKTSWQR